MLAILVVVGLVALGSWFVPWLGTQTRRRHVTKRPPLEPEAFYATFYTASGLSPEAVVSLLKDLERATGIPARFLRPEDRLWEGTVVEESLFDSLHAIEVETMLEEISEHTGCRIHLADLQTVDAYIRALAPWTERLAPVAKTGQVK
ncbi:MAG: hypothetical protein L0099_07890 [Acidobacteria bacterium]|nr:hypothetical protein [Acidobacteriota bacterium]